MNNREFHVELCILIGSGVVNREVEKLKAIYESDPFTTFIIIKTF